MFAISTMLAQFPITTLAAVRLRKRLEPSPGGTVTPAPDHTRRWLLSALVVAVVAATAPGSGDGARAAGDSHKRPDYGSKLAFKLECELLGGTFSEDGIGNTYCDTPYGGVIECDANGNDCWYSPGDEAAGPGGFPRPPFGPGNYLRDGPVLLSDDLSSADTQPRVAAADDDRKQDHGKRKRKGKKGGKRHK
jgi:hypothetical protein